MEDKHTSSDFVPLYKEIAEEIGVENTVKLFMHFKGQQMTCPQRLFSIEYVKKYVKENYDGTNIKELARKFGYSERRIRDFLKEKDSL